MTTRTNARLAGVFFLVYIAASVLGMVLYNQASGDVEGPAAVLASLARQPTLVRLTALLELLTCFDAVVLGVALYALTRDQDRDLAALALACRVVEGTIGGFSAARRLELLSVAQASVAAEGPDRVASVAMGSVLLQPGGSGSYLVAASCFAVGSTIFSYLFLRARTIPVPLAWLGVVASILLVAVLPLQLMGWLEGAITSVVWAPMAVFEVGLAFWLLVKGLNRHPVPAVFAAM